LEECLSTIHSQTFRDFETIVVDNGSTDGSVDWLKDRCGNAVSTVALPSNLGFAGGNNAGIRAARGRYVILLNNDTAVDPGWLAALAGAVRRHPTRDVHAEDPELLPADEIDNTGHLIYPTDGARRHRSRKTTEGSTKKGRCCLPAGVRECTRKRCSTRSACSTSRSLPTGRMSIWACAADGVGTIVFMCRPRRLP